MPFDILSLVEKDKTLSTCQIFNAEVCYGSGLRYDTFVATGRAFSVPRASPTAANSRSASCVRCDQSLIFSLARRTPARRGSPRSTLPPATSNSTMLSSCSLSVNSTAASNTSQVPISTSKVFERPNQPQGGLTEQLVGFYLRIRTILGNFAE